MIDKIKYILLKLVCLIKGHDWDNWMIVKTKMHFIPTGDKNSSECDRCFNRRTKDWTKAELKILQKYWNKSSKAIAKGEMGQLYGVRFMETTRK